MVDRARAPAAAAVRMIRAWPVIFSGPMVKALLDGRKTMTRRLPTPMWHAVARHHEAGGEAWLWVREKAVICPPRWTDTPINPMGSARQEVGYMADTKDGELSEAARDYNLKLTPSIHLPRWASRLSLKIEAIRPERLQEISEADAVAEGILAVGVTTEGEPVFAAELTNVAGSDPRQGFELLWDDLHCPCKGDWDDCRAAGKCRGWVTNPTIYAIRFTLHRRNINDILAAKEAA